MSLSEYQLIRDKVVAIAAAADNEIFNEQQYGCRTNLQLVHVHISV